jgi:hypothetical protein
LGHGQIPSAPYCLKLWAITAELTELLQPRSHGPQRNNTVWPFKEKFIDPPLVLKHIMLFKNFILSDTQFGKMGKKRKCIYGKHLYFVFQPPHCQLQFEIFTYTNAYSYTSSEKNINRILSISTTCFMGSLRDSIYTDTQMPGLNPSSTSY